MRKFCRIIIRLLNIACWLAMVLACGAFDNEKISFLNALAVVIVSAPIAFGSGYLLGDFDY